MTQEIEIEYKNLLTEDEFHLLLASFPFPHDSMKQVNYYFETDDYLLKKKQCALRIREKNNKYQLTLKEPHPDGILETHHTLSEQEAFDWINGNERSSNNVIIQLAKKGIDHNNINYLGSLTTNRYEITWKEVLLVLDYSNYNKRADYEFELEASDRATGIECFQSILSTHQIPIRETKPKIQRFLETMK